MARKKINVPVLGIGWEKPKIVNLIVDANEKVLGNKKIFETLFGKTGYDREVRTTAATYLVHRSGAVDRWEYGRWKRYTTGGLRR